MRAVKWKKWTAFQSCAGSGTHRELATPHSGRESRGRWWTYGERKPTVSEKSARVSENPDFTLWQLGNIHFNKGEKWIWPDIFVPPMETHLSWCEATPSVTLNWGVEHSRLLQTSRPHRTGPQFGPRVSFRSEYTLSPPLFQLEMYILKTLFNFFSEEWGKCVFLHMSEVMRLNTLIVLW